MSSTTAVYPRDEVSGPLGSAPGHENGQEAYKTVKKTTTQVTQEEITEPTKGTGNA